MTDRCTALLPAPGAKGQGQRAKREEQRAKGKGEEPRAEGEAVLSHERSPAVAPFDGFDLLTAGKLRAMARQAWNTR